MSDFSELPHITNDQQHNPLPDLLTQLYRFMVAVSEAATPLQIAMLCIDEGVKVLGAATCTVTRLRDNQTVEQIRSMDTIPRQWHSSPIASLHGVETVIQTRQAIWVRSPNECDIYFPNSLAATYQSGVILPLVVSERMIGTIEFAFTVPNALDVANETFITLFSLQCALAMDRAQLYEKEQQIRDDSDKAKQRMTMLAQAGMFLTETLDYETTLKTLSDVLIPAFADSYVVDVIDEADQFRRIALRAIDQEAEAALEELTQRYPPDRERTNIGRAFKTQRASLISDAPAAYHQFVRDAEHLALIQRVNVQSQISLPLLARNHIIGVISIIMSRSGRRYTEDDLGWAEELARRVANAVDHARLYAAEQRARHEAEDAVKIRNEFLSVAAHELKTPITSLRGFAQMLLRQQDKKGVLEAGQLQRSLIHLDRQSAKLTRLVNALLDISRLQAGRLMLELKPLDVVELVRQTTEIVQRTTQSHTITLDTPETLTILGDPLRLEQVLINLLDNAVKYSPNGGPIIVNVAADSLEAISISIRDHGLGIAPDLRSRIFDQFFQAHGKGYRGGMGLGLYISYQIIELHNGTIDVEFPDEDGTQFIIRLPIRWAGNLL